MPSAVDSFDYERRARLFLELGFREAFQDAFRVPGYPLVISLFIIVFNEFAFAALRAIQILLTALAIPLIYNSLKRTFGGVKSFTLSFFFSLLPSWYFSPLLLAESLSYFLCVLLVIKCISIIRRNIISKRDLLSISLIIVMATYLKPNHIFWIAPMLVLVISISKTKLFTSLLLSGSVCVGLIPWLIFANGGNSNHFVLTSASGGNLYVGTGMRLSYDESPLASAAIFWEVDPKNNPDDDIILKDNLSAKQVNDIYTAKAIEIWRERTLRQIGFGASKVAIAFGVFSESIEQSSLGIIFLASISLAVYVLLSNRYIFQSKQFCFLFLSFTTILAIQAFIFQADRRFVFPVLIPAWLLLLEVFSTKTRHRLEIP